MPFFEFLYLPAFNKLNESFEKLVIQQQQQKETDSFNNTTLKEGIKSGTTCEDLMLSPFCVKLNIYF